MEDRIKELLLWIYLPLSILVCTWVDYLLWSSNTNFNIALLITSAIVIITPLFLTFLYLEVI